MRIDAAIKSDPNYSRKFHKSLQHPKGLILFLRDFSKPRDFHPLIYVVAHQMLLFALFSSWNIVRGSGGNRRFFLGWRNDSGEKLETIMCIFGVIVTSLPFRRQSGASFKNIFSGERENLDLCVFYGFFARIRGIHTNFVCTFPSQRFNFNFLGWQISTQRAEKIIQFMKA